MDTERRQRKKNKPSPSRIAARRARIEKLFDTYPLHERKFVRQFLIALHERELTTIDAIYEEAAERSPMRAPQEGEVDTNAAVATPWTATDKAVIREIVSRHSAEHFSCAEIDDFVNLVRKREKARGLEDIAGLPEVSSQLLKGALADFCALPVGGMTLRASEALGTRVALIRHFISDQLDFIKIAKHRFTIRYLNDIVQRIITADSAKSSGRIGGKAAGLLLARAILETKEEDDQYDFGSLVRYPESWFVSTDVCEAFITANDLQEYRSQKYKTMDEIRNETRMIREIFRNSPMMDEVLDQLRDVLREAGDSPLIVRSSSLLEDNFGSGFPGKYDSIFLGNQGDEEDRLQALSGAIAEVYATVFGPDPIEYRRERDLLDYDESMGILIQKVVGRRVGKYYLPLYGGVGFSRNDVRWSKRIRREDGLLRVVFGMGTRAVDRVGQDYPRLIPMTSPTLRPEIGTQDIRYYSQKIVDAVDLEKNRFVHLKKDEVFGAGPFPGLQDVVSVIKDGTMARPVSRLIDFSQPTVITFDGFVHDRQQMGMLRELLKKLERLYKCPVDIEFAHDGDHFYLLQCRPQAQRIELERVHIPARVDRNAWVFTANRYVATALEADIEYILYIDPKDYDAVDSYADKVRLGRLVAALNYKFCKGERFILMGPGRWGSNNIDLGIQVSYADINHTQMLIEIAREKGGMMPDVSFGTHFFQDLVESGIHHLALFPERPDVFFNEGYLRGAPNALSEVLPAFADLARYAQLIHVPSASDGRKLTVAMDGEDEQALAYLA